MVLTNGFYVHTQYLVEFGNNGNISYLTENALYSQREKSYLVFTPKPVLRQHLEEFGKQTTCNKLS